MHMRLMVRTVSMTAVRVQQHKYILGVSFDFKNAGGYDLALWYFINPLIRGTIIDCSMYICTKLYNNIRTWVFGVGLQSCMLECSFWLIPCCCGCW